MSGRCLIIPALYDLWEGGTVLSQSPVPEPFVCDMLHRHWQTAINQPNENIQVDAPTA